MEKFTPGPWICQNTSPDSHNQGVVYSEKTGENIAVVYDRKNLKPISAVPDLLEALEEAAKLIRNMSDDMQYELWESYQVAIDSAVARCDEAIRKATD